jgi:uncharacterized protein YjiS (DUF1127 family)
MAPLQTFPPTRLPRTTAVAPRRRDASTRAAPGTPGAGIRAASAVVAVFAGLVARLQARRRAARGRSELRELDARMLADIGLSRGGVRLPAAGPRSHAVGWAPAVDADRAARLARSAASWR